MTKSIRLPLAVRFAAVAAMLGAGATRAQQDPFLTVYRDNCSVCHGEKLEGAAQGTPLAGVALKHGDSIAEHRTESVDGLWSQRNFGYEHDGGLAADVHDFFKQFDVNKCFSASRDSIQEKHVSTRPRR